MSKLQIKRLIVTALLALTISPISSNAAEEKVVAVVNGSNILESTLNLYQQRRGIPRGTDPAQQRKAILEELINMELLYQDALKNNADKSPDFTEALEKELEHLKRNMLASYMLNKRAKSTNVSDEDMKKEYEKRKPELAGKEYRASHILLESEDDAKTVIKELDKGTDFAKLAKEKSTGPSATHGGELGWVSSSEMVKEFSDAVAKLDDNNYTSTPVKTQFGWHVILRTGARGVDAPSFESLKEQLRMRLQNKIVEDYIGSLRKGAQIERKQ